MKSTLFSTDAHRPADRYEAWRNRDWPSLAPVMDSMPPEAPFSARTETFSLAGIPLTYARIDGLDYVRSQSLIRRDGIDHVGIAIMVAGTYSGETRASAFAGGAGTVLIGEFGQPFRQRSTRSETVTLALPRAIVRRALPALEGVHGLVLDGAAATLIVEHVLMLRRNLRDVPDVVAPMLAEALVNTVLAGLAMSGQALAGDERGDAVAALQASRIIAQRLADPDLDVNQLVALTGISRSALYRAFAPEGGVATYIRRQRLEAAHRALADPGNAAQISEIAYRCGFTDPAQFSRAFRAEYGMSPRQLRASLPR
ncbi:helix-turn-helix domain-containing protein [Arsenicitalea aurantiaca]|uniref:Helix-turn-helix domain-containing protein n=1 Tax=Arsenicitalea aurantiaca TaxID=1783274 RepID=A0A433XLS0_9HYPH|nr:helix-turn-helix domain-containing protein [Arsenicitalea aurantiaca]RUT35037.1 helix-turn-helix domain-containing protein [Arsenicitalea aurantiaca]